jgi:hypothetical protein
MAKGICLDGREYKLLLRPDCIGGGHDAAAANRFLADFLTPAVQATWVSGGSARLHLEEAFELDKRRTVRLYDTERRLLKANDFILRERRTVVDGKPTGDTEITLKFRTTDMYVAAGTDIPGAKPPEGKKQKKLLSFEEDIAPLEVTADGTSGAGRVVANVEPSIRSRFAKSSKQFTKREGALATLDDVFRCFPTLPGHLGHVSSAGSSAPMLAGPEIDEWVFEGPKIDLGNDHRAKFALTLWYLGKESRAGEAIEARSPDIAEISFEIGMKDGKLPRECARLALALFVTMQKLMPSNPQAASKTALAQP